MTTPTWRRALATLAALFAGGWSAVAAAQSGQAQSGFQAVPGGVVVQEQLAAAPLVYAAYAFVWLVLIVYVFLLWRRLGRVERDLAEVSAKVQARSR